MRLMIEEQKILLQAVKNLLVKQLMVLLQLQMKLRMKVPAKLVSNCTPASAEPSRFIVLAGTLKIIIATHASIILRLKNMPF